MGKSEVFTSQVKSDLTCPSLVAVKDYRLCRRNSDEDLFTNEENGIILDSQ
jgi:hypothetical protein